MDVKSSLEEIRSERFKDGGVWIDQFDEYIQECLTKLKNALSYRRIGRNRRMALIKGYNRTVHREPFQKCHSRPIRDEALRCSLMRCDIKRLRLAPLDRDLTIKMLPARLNHDRYNSPIYATCV